MDLSNLQIYTIGLLKFKSKQIHRFSALSVPLDQIKLKQVTKNTKNKTKARH